MVVLVTVVADIAHVGSETTDLCHCDPCPMSLDAAVDNVLLVWPATGVAGCDLWEPDSVSEVRSSEADGVAADLVMGVVA